MLHRKNLTVLTGAQVKRVLLEAGRASGVEYERGGELFRASAADEVILAAGAVASPQLLQLSGIGPWAVLSPLGIPVLHELNGVGGNLQDHLQMRLGFKVRHTRTLNERSQSGFQKALMGVEYLVRRTGPLTMAPSQLGAFAPSDASRETPNLEFHVQPLSLDLSARLMAVGTVRVFRPTLSG